MVDRKGSAVLRMLSAQLGDDKFLQGIHNYLKKHSFANATTNDLWDALTSSSGQSVQQLMDDWIFKTGYPCLTVTENKGQLSVRQSRYLQSGDVDSEDDETIWWIPLGLRSGSISNQHAVRTLTTKEQTIHDIDEKFYILNQDYGGFFRTSYPPSRLIALGKARSSLSVSDRIGLVSDSYALAVSAKHRRLHCSRSLRTSRTKRTASSGSKCSQRFRPYDECSPAMLRLVQAMKKFSLKLVSPTVERLGWAPKPGEDELVTGLRGDAMQVAGLCGHAAVITEAKRLYDSYMTGNRSAVLPSLRRRSLQHRHRRRWRASLPRHEVCVS
ncbi:hypothetical protein MRB53_041869 [Persea americana]|nr:hypothetical protein MRB53_041869 [Persea americana]